MSDGNPAMVLYGVQPMIDAAKADAVQQAVAESDAKIAGYTQTAVTKTAIALGIGATREVAFTSLGKLEPGGTAELTLVGGAVVIPDAANGRWTPVVVIDATIAVALTVEIRVYDAAGALVGSVDTTDYPARRTESLVVGSGTPFVAFAPIGHLKGAGAYTIRVLVSSTVAANITKVQMRLNKSVG